MERPRVSLSSRGRRSAGQGGSVRGRRTVVEQSIANGPNASTCKSSSSGMTSGTHRGEGRRRTSMKRPSCALNVPGPAEGKRHHGVSAADSACKLAKRGELQEKAGVDARQCDRLARGGAPPRSICRRHTQCAAAQQASFRGQPSPAPALSWAARKAPAQPRTPALRLGSCTSRPTPAPAWCSAARMATARPCAWFGAACRCCRGGSAARALLRASRESAAACAA
eukprot:1197657-Pleurochrysis_carterae.AAC.1